MSVKKKQTNKTKIEIHTATFPSEQSPNDPSVNDTHGL